MPARLLRFTLAALFPRRARLPMSSRDMGCVWTADLRSGLGNSNDIDKQFQRSDPKTVYVLRINNAASRRVRQVHRRYHAQRGSDPGPARISIRVSGCWTGRYACSRNNQLRVELQEPQKRNFTSDNQLGLRSPFDLGDHRPARMRPAGTARM